MAEGPQIPRVRPWDEEGLEDLPEYRIYLDVRSKVLRMMEMEGSKEGLHRPSRYWSEELSNFDYLLDASPRIIRKLRHHTFHLTGLHVYDYRSNQTKKRGQLAAKLGALKALDRSGLLVSESLRLGGFGYEIDGRRYNIDTLKFYEVLIGMERSGVLRSMGEAAGRPLVWEIGAGWGGFAFVWKTLFPRTTYLILDFPEVMLFSATYLRSLFPEARVRMLGDVPVEDTFRGSEDLDFIFVPPTFLGSLQPPRVDLTVNMVSFQEMTEAQVEAYVGRAADLGCPLLYSLNRKRSKYNTEIDDVSAIIGRRFRTEPVHVLPVSYNLMLPKAPPGGWIARLASRLGLGSGPPPPDNSYRHVVGRLAVPRDGGGRP